LLVVDADGGFFESLFYLNILLQDADHAQPAGGGYLTVIYDNLSPSLASPSLTISKSVVSHPDRLKAGDLSFPFDL